MYLLYSLKLAIQSLLREKWINFLSVLTIATGLFIIAITFFAVYNMNLATKKLPEKFSVMIYLSKDLPEKEAENIILSLKKNSAIESVRYISKDKALEDMKGILKNADFVLEGLNENPLPASIEIRLRKESVDIASVKKLTADIKKINGIEDVEYGEKFLNSLHSIKAAVEMLSLIIIIIMCSGIIFVCYSTVKIMFYRRKEEIETYKLLGATRGFIRAPFLIEGAAIGLASGVATLFAALLFDYALFNKLVKIMPIFNIAVFPSEIFIALPFAGFVLGIGGALIALGRVRFS
ncbi:MAG: ABC transporter permease [Nitrospiraceae bacterium]|nr:ABC transporter permease [Nitrospiraceae bacterium]